jgi:hypothetical protein
MGEHRIPEATTFALEMARTALWQIPAPHDFSGMWMHMDMQMGDDRFRSVSLRIRIHGVESQINAQCHVQKEHNEWAFGDCTITLDDIPGESWFFKCRREVNRMTATLTPFSTSVHSPETVHVRQDDQLRCPCGTYADGRVNYVGKAACSEWPDCVLD